MALELSDLHPYTSLTVAHVAGRQPATEVVRTILDDVEELLALSPDGPQRRVARGEPVRDGRLTIGFLHYEEHGTPTWTDRSDVRDVVNQLFLICVRGRHAALLFSDASRGRGISSRFAGSGSGLAALEAIESGVLNAAFAGGRALTLWLTGIHRRTTVKADSKVLTGTDLRDALDPLGDQTYYHTAARWRASLGPEEVTVGVAGRRSGVWTGPSRTWLAFRTGVEGLLGSLEETRRERRSDTAPLPVLATPGAGGEDVHTAFDVNVLPPEGIEEASEELQEIVERWSYQANFGVVHVDGTDLSFNIVLDGEHVGTVDAKVTITADRARFVLASHPATGREEIMSEFEMVAGQKQLLQIRYESGHTISDGLVWCQRFRDQQFPHWSFPDFTGFDVRKEKPTKPGKDRPVFAPERVGAQDSLFCWVQKHWPHMSGAAPGDGWLVCDDGAMEIADFIHLDESVPRISLIHVKGAASSGKRGLSVAAYEVVTSQAVKNLRHLDQMQLGKGIAQGLKKQIGKLVWHDGKKQDGRTGFLDALSAAGARSQRRVVILQPQVQVTEMQIARQDQEKGRASSGLARLRQLDTLLLGAQANCGSLGADLLVLGDGTPETPKAGVRGRRRR